MEILKVLIPAVGAVLAAVLPVIITIISQARKTRQKMDGKEARDAEQFALIKKIDNDNQSLKNGTMQLLGKEIDDDYFKYKSRGSIPLTAKTNLRHIYETYSSLDGNGEREKEWEYLNGLKIDDDK